MALNYSESFNTRRATANVAGTGDANYRIDYIVRNPNAQPISSVTATIFLITVEGEGEAAVEKAVRVGNAAVDVAYNRNYFAFEKHAAVPIDSQASIAKQYFSDVKSILNE